MPRVRTKTKSTRGREYTCRVCHKPIEPGSTYYVFEKRYGGPNRRHTSCGYPRPTELSSRKTAQITEAWMGFPVQVESEDEIRDALQQIADCARDVGQEYQDSFDNLPENFQMGYTGEAMQEVAQELDSYADDLESWEPDNEEPTEDDVVGLTGVDVDDPESVREAVEEARSMWLDECLSDARDKEGDMPEYQG